MRSLTLAASLLLSTSAFAGFGTSSEVRMSRSGESFGAASALDGDTKTCWQVDPEQDNAGQWIELDVPTGKVDKISVVVGWDKDEQTWTDHARLSKARIQIYDMDSGEPKLVHEEEAELKDVKDRQFIDLPDPKVGGEMLGGKVRLTVVGVHPGKDYAHLALGELLVHMTEFDAKGVQIVGTPSSEAEGHDGGLLFDESTRTFWSTDGEQETAEFTMGAGRYSVSSIGLVPGPKTHARPKKIEVTQSNVTRIYEVPDKSGTHWFELPALVGYTGSGVGEVTVKITETYPGSSSKATAVAEVYFRATMLDAF